MSYRKLIAEDRNTISYRPSLRTICGSVFGVILLTKVLEWDEEYGGKFKKHLTWGGSNDDPTIVSILNFSPEELKEAIDYIGWECSPKHAEKLAEKMGKSVRDIEVINAFASKKENAMFTYNLDSRTDLITIKVNRERVNHIIEDLL